MNMPEIIMNPQVVDEPLEPQSRVLRALKSSKQFVGNLLMAGLVLGIVVLMNVAGKRSEH